MIKIVDPKIVVPKLVNDGNEMENDMVCVSNGDILMNEFRSRVT